MHLLLLTATRAALPFPFRTSLVRVVLMLVGHAFTLRTSESNKEHSPPHPPQKGNSPQLQVTGGTGGSARLLTVTNKDGVWSVAANPKAVQKEARPALQTLAKAVMEAGPEVDFVLDIVHQPLTETNSVNSV